MITENKTLRIALIISAILHGSVVFLPYFKFKLSQIESKQTDLTYIKQKTEELLKLKEQLPKRDIGLRQRHLPPQPSSKSPEKDSVYKTATPRPLSSLLAKENILSKISEFLKTKPQLTKPDIIAVRKKIALRPLELDKISNPSYISYYQIIREKIRRCAYQNYSSDETGDVYISFLIASDGNLIKTKVIDEKSSPNPYLKDVAIKSINDAAAFPAFPQDLNYPELSFNVIISFEIE